MINKFIRRNLGVTALAVALLFRFAFDLWPAFHESVYFNGIFPIIRTGQDSISAIWLVPGWYVFAFVCLLWLIWRFPRSGKWKRFGKRLANFLSGGVAIFLLCFGFQYADKGFANRLALPPTPDAVDLSAVYIDVLHSAEAKRKAIPGIDSLPHIVAIEEIPTDDELTEWVRTEIAMNRYPTAHLNPRIQYIKPKGLLRRLGISGIYNPFTGEANVDAALPSIHRVFVVAHELAHAYGVTSEAEANFVAYLACLNSGDPLGEYAAQYALWRQVASEVSKTYPMDVIETLAAQIPVELQADRLAIREAYLEHRVYFPKVSEQVNETYLKLQGIEEGVADYDRFLQIYLAWKTTKN